MGATLVQESSYGKLANIIFNKRSAFTLKEIFEDLESDYDEYDLKKTLELMKENGIIIQQGSFYSLRR